ncbi:Ribokinase-like protein [Aspergillus nidulans var. acristatus]
MSPVLSDSEAYDEQPSISFTSLGLLVLDEIRLPRQEPLTDVLGGSGAYASLGARLFLPTPLDRSLGWMMNIGNDFPEQTRRYFESWGATMIVKEESSKPSTRGLLEYRDTTFGPKDFMYTTSVLQIDVSSLKSTPLIMSKAYHFLESPANIKSRASEILALRQSFGIPKPLIIWEPAPLSCKAENLQSCMEATHKEKIKSMALKFLNTNEGIGPDGKGIMIVRAGEEGCLVCARHIPPTWLPPFYRYGHDKVVDPTGAGNAFLGAFAIGYLQTGDAVQAAYYGSIGASFALEQVGLPRLTRNEGASASGELWNGEDVLERLREYRRGVRGAEYSPSVD